MTTITTTSNSAALPQRTNNSRMRITLSALAGFATLAAASLESASADQRRFKRRNGRTTLQSLGTPKRSSTPKRTSPGTVLMKPRNSFGKSASIRAKPIPRTINKIYKTLPIIGLKRNRNLGGRRGTSASGSIRSGLLAPDKSKTPPKSSPPNRRMWNNRNRGNRVPNTNCQCYTVRYHMHGRKMTPMISRKFAFRYANYLQSLGFEAKIVNVNGIDYVDYQLQGSWQMRFQSHTSAHVFEKWLTLKGVHAKVIHN